jgi:hypothetical protein
MSSQKWFLPWDYTPVYATISMVQFLVAKEVKTIPHLPYLTDLTPADFFLFPE